MTIKPQIWKKMNSFQATTFKASFSVFFFSLHDIDKRSFFTVKEKFLQEFNGQDSPALVAKEGSFQNLKHKKSPGQRVEDFCTSFAQKDALLHKLDEGIFHKFVSGLPDKLAFFVRASCIPFVLYRYNVHCIVHF